MVMAHIQQHLEVNQQHDAATSEAGAHSRFHRHTWQSLGMLSYWLSEQSASVAKDPCPVCLS